MEENSYVLKHTGAVHISNVLTLIQRKVSNILLKHAFHKLNQDIIHKVSLSYVMRHLGWGENSEATKLLKNSLKELNGIQIEWNIFNKDRKQIWGVTTLLAYVQITNGIIEYSYSKPLRELLYKPNIYARLDLDVQKNFSNKHGLALWEYISEYLCSSKVFEIQTDEMLIENFKKFLGINNHKTYVSFSALNAQVITPAINEVNKKSDIQIEVKFKRQGKKITSIWFIARRKGVELNPTMKNELPIGNDKIALIIKEGTLLGLSEKLIKQHLAEFEEERVAQALNIVREDIKNGKKINSLQGYYVSCLKNSWERSIPLDELNQDKEARFIQQLSTEKNFIEEKQYLLNKLGVKTYKSWVEEVQFEAIDNQRLIIKAPTRFKADYINTHFSCTILEAWQESGKSISQIEISYC